MSFAERVNALRASLPETGDVNRFPFEHDLLDVWSSASGAAAARVTEALKALPSGDVLPRATIDSILDGLAPRT